MNMVSMWNDMSGRNRTGLSVGIVVVLAFMIFGIFWLMRERFAVLFADLQTRDAAGIVSQLERLKVDYQLEDGGSRILVPEDAVHGVRLKLMGSGVPISGGVGFEIFDNSDFGMTEFAQRINFQRALQGELTRTIMALKEVKYARVHLVMPEGGLFEKKNSEPSASVTLFLQNGDKPSDQQIHGIQRLVAAAVSGLRASQVTVTDQNGLTLSRQVTEDEGVEAVSLRLQQKKAVEQYLAEKAMEMLERVFDSRNVLVSVDAILDFSQVKTTKESVLPLGDGSSGIVRRRESKFGGDTEKNANGNVTTEVEYQLGRSVAQIVEMPGRITRLSIGVLVPETVSEEQRVKISELVAVAVGMDKTRGDAIGVYPLEPVMSKVLSETASEAPPPDAGKQEALLQMAGSQNSETAKPVKLGILEYLKEHFVAAGIAAATLLFVFILLITRLVSGKSSKSELSPGLSVQERDQILQKLSDWLESGAGEERSEVKP